MEPIRQALQEKLDHRIDTVRLAHILRPVVGRVQFREFLFVELEIQHVDDLTPRSSEITGDFLTEISYETGISRCHSDLALFSPFQTFYVILEKTFRLFNFD